MTRLLAAPSILLSGCLLASAAGADQRDPRLNGLFDQVQSTREAEKAALLDRAIWSIWLDSGDAETDRLLQEGTLAMARQAWPAAQAAFDSVIERRPEFAEGWNKRATLFYLTNRYDESARDVAHALALEPRHYGALSGMGLIELQRRRLPEALDWFGKALAVNPNLNGIREMAEQLTIKVKGRPI